MLNAFDHEFEFIGLHLNCEWFICKICKIKTHKLEKYNSILRQYYNENIYYFRPNNHYKFKELNLSCNECIILNIIK